MVTGEAVPELADEVAPEYVDDEPPDDGVPELDDEALGDAEVVEDDECVWPDMTATTARKIATVDVTTQRRIARTRRRRAAKRPEPAALLPMPLRVAPGTGGSEACG